MVFDVEQDKRIVDCLVIRIQNKMINPRTAEIFKLEDIKIEEFRIKVEEILKSQEEEVTQ